MVDNIDYLQKPVIPESQLKQCRETGDFRPVLFEWYKYVGTVCNYYASIRQDSPALREIPAQHYVILTGLLNRCSRLMLANVVLSHQGRFGETTSIIDRCIFESSIKAIWLCTLRDQDAFVRFIADGLKSELELKREIEKNILTRNTKKMVIEERGSIGDVVVEIAWRISS